MTRADLAAKHGTPEEFEAAVWRAAAELDFADVRRAIDDYRREWAEAPHGDVTRIDPATAEVIRLGGFRLLESP